MNVENVMESMELQPDAQTTQQFFGLFTKDAMLGYAGMLIKILVVACAIFLIRKVLCHLIDKVFHNRFATNLAQNSSTSLEEKRLHTLSRMFKSIISYVLYFVAIITILDMLGFSVTTIIAGAGIVSLAVAFGAQSIVQDLMSGIFIVLENQYAVGEIVQIDTVSGKVKEIGMKTTKIETVEGHLMIISNGSIGKVINFSRAAQRGFVDVGIAYEENLSHAISVMQKACDMIAIRYKNDLEEQPNVLGAISLDDSSVTVRATFTAWHWMHLEIERELRKEIKETLAAEGVEISYPKLQLVTGSEVTLCQ